MKYCYLLLLLVCTFQGFSQQPIYVTIAGGDLYTISLSNCSRRFIGATGQGFGDIAVTPNGRLWGIVSSEIYEIDTATAEATLIGLTPVGAVSLVALNDTILFAEYETQLFAINNITAEATLIGTIGYQADGDLTWYDDDLYLATSAGQIVRIVMDATYSEIISVTVIENSIPVCEGSITAAFPGEYNAIVGFNGPDAIKICPIDGSYEMLCPNVNEGGTPGAAYMRLATQDPIPTTCEVPKTVNIDNTENPKILLYPNPTSQFLTIQLPNNLLADAHIYSIQGEQVLNQQLEKNETTLDLSTLSAGVYFIIVSNDTFQQQFKIVKE